MNSVTALLMQHYERMLQHSTYVFSAILG